MDDKFLKYVRAILNPKVIETLKSNIKEYIGKELIFQYGWIIDKDENKVYGGQYAMLIISPKLDISCTWVPEEDVDIIEEVEYTMDV